MKTKEEVLNQLYVTPQDVKVLVPTIGIETCRNMIEEVRTEMRNKNYFVPETKPKIALTSLVKKKLGIR